MYVHTDAVTAGEDVCDPGTRKWVVFHDELGKRRGPGIFMIHSRILNTRIEMN